MFWEDEYHEGESAGPDVGRTNAPAGPRIVLILAVVGRGCAHLPLSCDSYTLLPPLGTSSLPALFCLNLRSCGRVFIPPAFRTLFFRATPTCTPLSITYAPAMRPSPVSPPGTQADLVHLESEEDNESHLIGHTSWRSVGRRLGRCRACVNDQRCLWSSYAFTKSL